MCFLAFSVDVNSFSYDMHNMCYANIHSSQFKQSPFEMDPVCFTRTLKFNYSAKEPKYMRLTQLNDHLLYILLQTMASIQG